MLAIFLLLSGGVRAGEAARAVLSPDSPKESPWLSEVLRDSARGSRDLLGLPVDPSLVRNEIQRLADRLRPEVSRASDEGQVIDAFRRVLLIEEGFVYDKSSSDPGNYLLETVLARKKGNCLGLSMLYLSIADRLGLPFHGVYVPSHCFVRYEGKTIRRNVEFAEGGVSWEDARYRREFRIGPERPYLRSLYPGLPDVHYNAGVSLQRLGRLDEALVRYHRAAAWRSTPGTVGFSRGSNGRTTPSIHTARRS